MNILVLGATGMVGNDLVRLFKKEKDIEFNLHLCNRKNYDIMTYNLLKYNVIFNCSNSKVSEDIISRLPDNVIFIDNSSYLRSNDKVPLVVPEINMVKSNVYANPNCVTIILTLFLNSIKTFEPKNIEVSTYQSISGAGKNKFNIFLDDNVNTIENISEKHPQANISSNKLAFNFYPHESEKNNDDFNGEEEKVIKETKKILGMDVFPTCIRVPAIRCHGETITCEFKKSVTKEQLIKKVEEYGLTYQENPEAIDMEMKTNVMVGHIRKSPFTNRWSFFIIGDQLTRGASYNAYKIFKNIIKIDSSNSHR